jgi:dCMP deaminase
METRPSWTEYFLDIADKVSTRSTCTRLKVGCVLVAEDNRILATGYNGSPKGLPHCIDDGCLLNEEGRCIRTIHSEINALLSIDANLRKGSTLYCNYEPCENCTKFMIQAGVKKVVFRNSYISKKNSSKDFKEHLKEFIGWEQYK